MAAPHTDLPPRTVAVVVILAVLAMAVVAAGIGAVLVLHPVPPPPPLPSRLTGGEILAQAGGPYNEGDVNVSFLVPPSTSGNGTGILVMIVVNLTCGSTYVGSTGLPIVCQYSLIEGPVGGPTADYVWLDVPFNGVWVASSGTFAPNTYTLVVAVDAGTGGEAHLIVPFTATMTVYETS